MTKRKNKTLLTILIVFGFLIFGLIIIPILLINKHETNQPAQEVDLKIKKEYQEFRITDNSQTTLRPDFAGGLIPLFRIKNDLSLEKFKSEIRIRNAWNNHKANIAFQVSQQGDDKVIQLEKGANFNPGSYQLKIGDPNSQNLVQNFSWGVLALNLNQSVYRPQEKAEIYLTALNDAGETECDAEISLTMTSPSGKKTVATSANGEVIKSHECQPKNFTEKPDFKVVTPPLTEAGRYQLIFEAKTKNGQYQIQDFLSVETAPDFIISRQSATRLFPPATYQMKIKIVSKNDFSGEVQEIVPASFKISKHQAIVKTTGNYKVITWTTKMVKDQPTILTYDFDGPDISPEFYLLGPLRFNADKGLGLEKIFEEPRAWQIAADAIPSNIIIAWLSPTPPTGWSRDTTLDSRFLKAVATGVDPGTTGGSTSHNHTSTHSHTHSAHTHVLTMGVASGGTTTVTATQTLGAAGAHTHNPFNSSSTTATEQNATITLDANTNSSMPPYYDVLWITSGGTTAVPSKGVVYYNSTTAPSGWAVLNGTAASPNLNNTYLRGAAAAGSPGGTGGYASHTHTISASHTHTQDSHSHTGSTGPGSCGTGDVQTDVTLINPKTHTHTVTINAMAITPGQNNFTIDATTWEPPYFTLIPIINNTGGADQPVNIIAMWRGTLANIPTGWTIIDINANFAKCSTSSYGSTGGTLGHSHTAASHSHVMSAHTHTGTVPNGSTAQKRRGSVKYPKTSHTHTLTVGSATDTVSNTAATIDTNADTQPPYYTVAYIQFTPLSPRNCYVVRDFSTNYLTLYWDYSDANEDSFQIYRSADGAAFASLGTAVADAVSYQDTTSALSHAYAYAVRAVYGASYSGWCQTTSQDLYKGNFKFQGVRMNGIRINFLPWLQRTWKTIIAFIANLYQTAYARVIET